MCCRPVFPYNKGRKEGRKYVALQSNNKLLFGLCAFASMQGMGQVCGAIQEEMVTAPDLLKTLWGEMLKPKSTVEGVLWHQRQVGKCEMNIINHHDEQRIPLSDLALQKLVNVVKCYRNECSYCKFIPQSRQWQHGGRGLSWHLINGKQGEG